MHWRPGAPAIDPYFYWSATTGISGPTEGYFNQGKLWMIVTSRVRDVLLDA
jgi:hypothetical protein